MRQQVRVAAHTQTYTHTHTHTSIWDKGQADSALPFLLTTTIALDLDLST